MKPARNKKFSGDLKKKRGDLKIKRGRLKKFSGDLKKKRGRNKMKRAAYNSPALKRGEIVKQNQPGFSP